MRKLDYDNLSDVLNEIDEVMVIDLLEYALSIDSKYIDMLEEPKKGIYLSGSIKPLMIFDNNKFYSKSLFRIEGSELTNLSMIMNSSEDIVDYNGEIVLSFSDKMKKKKYLLSEPNVPIVLINVALTIADNYLSSICEFSKTQYVNMSLNNLIKPEYHKLIEDEVFERLFRKLTNKISLFIKNDTWNIYFYKQRGTSLIIEKSIDWRVYRYYEMMLEENSS